MTTGWETRWGWAAGTLLAAAASGCGPWITTIPTYWDPVDWSGPDPEREVKITEPPELPPSAYEIHEYQVPKDTPEECRAVYLVSAENSLFAYKPQDNTFELRGRLQCPSPTFATPFSMAVARDGYAYVVYQDGNLYRVSTTDASCEATPFRAGQLGFNLFGMGFAANKHDKGETLYVAEISFRRASKGLASIDTKTFEVSYIEPFSFNPGVAIELTPTGKKGLHGYFINQPGTGGTLVKIDTDNGQILESTPLPPGSDSSSLAVSWFNGYFFIFTSVFGGTAVNRYDPKKKETKVVDTLNETIVGAGVSTCAPDRD
jgi:hypothetical protein